MKPAFSLGAVLAVASLALATAKDREIVDSETLRDSIEEAELVSKAQTIEAFAYAYPEKNRLPGTPGFEDTMQYIWDILDDLDYYDLSRQRYNIIAQTKEGDTDNVLHLGAHMDSVAAGPGINDNASGGIGILEVAIQLANYTVNNAVRFSWWSAEEEGLIGSEIYVDMLSEEERQKTRLYLNFDMIASPAHKFGVYTSDFSGLGVTPAPGVEEVEEMFQDYFDDIADLEWDTVALRGNSDHWPFVWEEIPTGGLHAGTDPNYHTANDTVANMDPGVFVKITKAIAHAVATYASPPLLPTPPVPPPSPQPCSTSPARPHKYLAPDAAERRRREEPPQAGDKDDADDRQRPEEDGQDGCEGAAADQDAVGEEDGRQPGDGAHVVQACAEEEGVDEDA
ncbi:hypothetical protein INS49_003355 [Diaporthe citri]|uniref:uncharacterized protein n=1 Tax=Diaporthe citri TaxID=83186 RepID=UPI001C80C5CD|nr:uncharacterized protein INS49_003355 [Diaporthe citri]KAG6355393.1 hypothetical protein INS49_003355 [Diaporthe citri]